MVEEVAEFANQHVNIVRFPGLESQLIPSTGTV